MYHLSHFWKWGFPFWLDCISAAQQEKLRLLCDLFAARTTVQFLVALVALLLSREVGNFAPAPW